MSARESGPGLRVVEAALVVAALVSGRRRRTRPGVAPSDVSAGYALEDMQVGIVIAILGALLITLAILLVLVTSFMAHATGLPPSISRPADLIQGLQAPPEPTPPAPSLQEQPGVDLVAYRASEQQRLNSYRWVDRNAGVVSIPIDRAMDLVVQRGLPARATPPTTPDQPGRSPSTASSGRVEEAWP